MATVAPAVASSGGASGGPRRTEGGIPEWVSSSSSLQLQPRGVIKERDFSLGFNGGGGGGGGGGVTHSAGSTSHPHHHNRYTLVRPLTYGYPSGIEMAVGGMLGAGVGESPAGGSGPYAGGPARLGSIGGGSGGINIVNRESLRDVVTRGGGGGGGGGTEDFVSLYTRVRREDDPTSAPRGGGSFVAYATTPRTVDDPDHHTNIQPSIPVLSSAHHREDDHGVDQGEIQVWQQARDLRGDGNQESKEKAMASQMRVMEISGAQQVPERRSDCELGATGDQSQLSNAENKNGGGGLAVTVAAMPKTNTNPNTITNSNSTTCQDCGNQAKKDCRHLRCRTCCKSRGFDCSTHLKSTWVPAAKRREKQQAEAAAIAAGHPRPKTKRARFVSSSNATTTSHTSTSATTPPRSSDINSTQIAHQDLNFKASLPAEIKTQAVFKCVRVTPIENGVDQFAYQATVKIGGHIFRGVLYDQRVDTANLHSNLPDLHLGGSTTVASTSAMIDPTAGGGVYGASSSNILGGPVTLTDETCYARQGCDTSTSWLGFPSL